MNLFSNLFVGLFGRQQPERNGLQPETIGQLTILNPKNKDGTLDVVFVTWKTLESHDPWKACTTEDCWPRDFLRYDMPEARIFMYHYDEDIGLDWLASIFTLPSSRRVMEGTAELEYRIRQVRYWSASSTRPMVLVGKGFGGVICKELFATSPLQQHVIGMILLGCPLRKSNSFFTQHDMPLPRIRYVGAGTGAGTKQVLEEIDHAFEMEARPKEEPRTVKLQIVLFFTEEQLIRPELKEFEPSLFRGDVTEDTREGAMINVDKLARFNSRQDKEYYHMLDIFETWLMAAQGAASPRIMKLSAVVWAQYSKLSRLKDQNAEVSDRLAALSAVLRVSQTRYSRRFMPLRVTNQVNLICKRIDSFLARHDARSPAVRDLDQLLKEVKDLNETMLCGRERLSLAERHSQDSQNEGRTSVSIDSGPSIGECGDLRLDPLALHPLQPGDQLRPNSSKLKHGIAQFLDERKINWSLIDVCYRSRVGAYKPVLIVAATMPREGDWEHLRSELTQQMHRLVPAFLGGEIGLELFDAQSIAHAPFIGCPMAINSVRATLGGYISLQKREADGSLGEFESGNFILTNHHLVHPGPQSGTSEANAMWQRPITLAAAEISKPCAALLSLCGCAFGSVICPYELEYQRLLRKREVLQGRNAKTTDIDELINKYQSVGAECRRSQGGIIGRVWATSGLRTSPQGRRLDWAIIKVNGDIECENLAPPSSSAIPYRAPLCFLPQTVDSIKRIKLARIEQGLQIIGKLGYRSPSYGIMNTAEPGLVRTPDWDQRTSELLAYGSNLNLWPNGHTILMPGDSGSWVLNSEGNLVGLMWGGCEPMNVAFVTPIEEVVKDILNQTDRIVRLSGGVDLLSRDDGTDPAYC